MECGLNGNRMCEKYSENAEKKEYYILHKHGLHPNTKNNTKKYNLNVVNYQG